MSLGFALGGALSWAMRPAMARLYLNVQISAGFAAAVFLGTVLTHLTYGAGFLTEWASLAMLVLMLGITWWSVFVARESLVSITSKGYDVNLALIALFLATALAGGGAYSLDALLGISPFWPFR